MGNMITERTGRAARPLSMWMAIAVLSTVTMLTACGSKTGSVRYALVCGPGTASSSDTEGEIETGIETYASEHAYPWKTYAASSAGTNAIAAQIKAASGDEAAYIICAGEDKETAVYNAQSEYKDNRFVLIEGEPRKNDSARSSIRSNTECVTCDRKSMGFLAGYIAVKEGYTKIAWLSGRKTEAGDEYYEGFLNGVGYGMQELGTSPDSVTVVAAFAGTDELSPRRMEEAKIFYDDGVQLIITDREKIAEAVRKAAVKAQKPYATVGFDALSSSENIQFSAIPNYQGLIRSLLMSFEEHKGFEGGTSVVCGAEQSAVRLSAEYSRMPVVTEVDTQTVLAAMATGQAVVSDSEAADGPKALGGNVKVTVKEPSGTSGEPASAADSQASSTDSAAASE